MFLKVLSGALIPLVGTSVGSLIAFVSLKRMSDRITALLSGFASGVMVAASVWSLLLPAIEFASYDGSGFLEPCIGLSSGLLLMIYFESFFGKYTANNSKEKLMYFAVTLHNLPEGMAIGAAYSAYVCSADESLALSALLLSVGIAIQNIPEGAIVSLPFKENFSKIKRFTFGVLSGIIEPVAVLLTVALSNFLVPILPFMLSFAAGAMIYVVLKELVPDFSEEESFRVGVISFFCGFMLMMSLDVALG